MGPHQQPFVVFALGCILVLQGACGVAVPSGPSDCVSDSCAGVPDGNYRWCSGCHVFVMCSNGLVHYQTCPAGLVYDAAAQACAWWAPQCAQDPCGCQYGYCDATSTCVCVAGWAGEKCEIAAPRMIEPVPDASDTSGDIMSEHNTLKQQMNDLNETENELRTKCNNLETNILSELNSLKQQMNDLRETCKCQASCGAGEEPNTADPLTCRACAVGTYSASTGGAACDTCPAGQTTLNIGSTAASDCRGTKFFRIEQTGNIPYGWSVARYSEVEDNLQLVRYVFEASPVYRWFICELQDGWIAGSGYDYEMGTDQRATGETLVVIETCPCPVGEEPSSIDASVCAVCPVGSWFESEDGNCIPCPVNQTIISPGSQSQSHCLVWSDGESGWLSGAYTELWGHTFTSCKARCLDEQPRCRSLDFDHAGYNTGLCKLFDKVLSEGGSLNPSSNDVRHYELARFIMRIE